MRRAYSCRANLTTAAPPKTLSVNDYPGVRSFDLLEAAVAVKVQRFAHQANGQVPFPVLDGFYMHSRQVVIAQPLSHPPHTDFVLCQESRPPIKPRISVSWSLSGVGVEKCT